jgi:hypothetical protein
MGKNPFAVQLNNNNNNNNNKWKIGGELLKLSSSGLPTCKSLNRKRQL